MIGSQHYQNISERMTLHLSIGLFPRRASWCVAQISNAQTSHMQANFFFCFWGTNTLLWKQMPARSPLWSWGLDPSLHPCPPSPPPLPCFYSVLIVILTNILCLHMTNCDDLCVLGPFCNNLTNSFSLTYILSGGTTLESFYTMTPWLGDHCSTGPGTTLTDTDISHRLINICFIIHYQRHYDSLVNV